MQEAGNLYRQILEAHPNHAEANHSMGLLAVQMKMPAAALPYLNAALDADPERGQYWLSYIDAMFQAGQVETARELLARAQAQGLQGHDADSLALRLQGVEQIESPLNADSHRNPKGSSPGEFSAVPQSSQGQSKGKFPIPGKSAKKKAKLKRERGPSAHEIEVLATLFGTGRYGEAANLAQAMTLRFPQHGFAWKALGVLLMQKGQSADALAPLLKATAFSPDDADAHSSLGNALSDLGRFESAVASLRRALKINPNFAEAHCNLGATLQDLGRSDEAEASYRRALQIRPDLPVAHYNLGNTLKTLKRLTEAEASYRKALQIKPNYAQAHCNLGIVLQDLGKLAEAEVSYRRALQIKPDYAQAHSNLGISLAGLGMLAEAEASYRQALQINPDLAETHSNLGLVLMDMGRLVEAEASQRKALAIAPEFAPAHRNLSTLSAYLSDYDLVVSESNTALSLAPESAMGWEQRLYAFSYHPDLSAAEIYAEFVRWGDRFPMPAVDFSAHDRTQNRRLRVGYVSPDFRRHTSRFFFWPLFANHDRTVVELYAYSNVAVEDDVTQSFKNVFEHWRGIRGVEDKDVARMIREDGIDILVDGCSHMRDDRLGVFTLKPAPIQVTWLGAAWTTGLKTMDYALIDPYMAPEATLTREAIVRLPHSFVAFCPPEATAEIAPPPCLHNGYITFGYSGRTERLNHHTFRVWGRILRAIPTARLILDFRSFDDPLTQEHYRQFMIRHGMNPDQVIMRKSANIFAGLNDIDILLDSFPHSGGTMLFDALWMGLPILTLASRPPVGRIGTSLMINLGLSEWVAESHEEYIDKATIFAQDVNTLEQLRAGMRDRMQSSPLMDGPGFARGVEAAYRDMFEKWASGPPAGPPDG